jgi:hypothetical protein
MQSKNIDNHLVGNDTLGRKREERETRHAAGMPVFCYLNYDWHDYDFAVFSRNTLRQERQKTQQSNRNSAGSSIFTRKMFQKPRKLKRIVII